MRTVCLYAYYEKNSEYKKNLSFFLQNGINNASDFVIIISGNCSVRIPKQNNIRVVVRANSGYDFGAWSEGLDLLNQNYDYYIFINTSVRGPYTTHQPWQDGFIDMLNDDVKLVGTTINIQTAQLPLLKEQGLFPPYPHVQSQVFAMDYECLMFLRDKVFDKAPNNFEEAIQLGELAMSNYVLKNNWNINCLLPIYHNQNYRKIDKDINMTSHYGDPSYKNKYFGNTYTPYQVMFIKTNRDLIEPDKSKTIATVTTCTLLLLVFLLFVLKNLGDSHV